MKEITFLVHEAIEGGYHAEAVGIGIFAEGDTIKELKESIKSGIECYFENPSEMPVFAHLHYTKDEVMSL
jgi:predicted RNase H-like HicB family nuclease